MLTVIAHSRRRVLRALGAVPLLGLSAAARGQGSAAAFPNRPVTLIVPFPAGGPTDRLVRALAEWTAPHLGQPVLVDNRPGAGGTLALAQMAANARPDGYTLAQYPGSMLRVPHLQKVAWHPIHDFSFVAGVAHYSFALVVRADAPWRSLADFAAAARQKAGAVDYGSSGVGSSGHMLMEQLAMAAGVTLTHVPFKGQADMLHALQGGHLMSICDASGWDRPVEEGRLRLLATFGEQPARRWPLVPTARAQGFDVVSASAHGLVGPKNIDAAIVKRLHDAFRAAMNEPRFAALLHELSQEPLPIDGAALRTLAERSFIEERRLIERLGLLAR